MRCRATDIFTQRDRSAQIPGHSAHRGPRPGGLGGGHVRPRGWAGGRHVKEAERGGRERIGSRHQVTGPAFLAVEGGCSGWRRRSEVA